MYHHDLVDSNAPCRGLCNENGFPFRGGPDCSAPSWLPSPILFARPTIDCMWYTSRTPHYASLSIAASQTDAHGSSASEWPSSHNVHAHELSLIRPQQNTLRGIIIFLAWLLSSLALFWRRRGLRRLSVAAWILLRFQLPYALRLHWTLIRRRRGDTRTRLK